MKPGIHHGRGFVDAPAYGGHNFVDNLSQVGIILEPDVGELQLSEPLHVDLFVGVDQDIRNGGVLQKGLQGPEAQDLIQDLSKKPLLFDRIQRQCMEILAENPIYNSLQFGLEDARVHPVENGKIELIQQAIVYLLLNSKYSSGRNALSSLSRFCSIARAFYALPPIPLTPAGCCYRLKNRHPFFSSTLTVALSKSTRPAIFLVMGDLGAM